MRVRPAPQKQGKQGSADYAERARSIDTFKQPELTAMGMAIRAFRGEIDLLKSLLYNRRSGANRPPYPDVDSKEILVFSSRGSRVVMNGSV